MPLNYENSLAQGSLLQPSTLVLLFFVPLLTKFVKLKLLFYILEAYNVPQLGNTKIKERWNMKVHEIFVIMVYATPYFESNCNIRTYWFFTARQD